MGGVSLLGRARLNSFACIMPPESQSIAAFIFGCV